MSKETVDNTAINEDKKVLVKSGNEMPDSASMKQRLVGGNVISNKMEKTITVSVHRRVKHPTYGKYITRTSRLHAHDENNEGGIGDTVELISCQPISKTKAWKLFRIIKRAEQ